MRPEAGTGDDDHLGAMGQAVQASRGQQRAAKEVRPFLWWLKTYHADSQSVDAYFASGWGGQRILVFPSLDMVVVLTGGNYSTHEPVQEILTRHILPAVQ